MSQVTVSQLADVLGVETGKLLAQLNDAGIEAVFELALVCTRKCSTVWTPVRLAPTSSSIRTPTVASAARAAGGLTPTSYPAGGWRSCRR